MRKRVRKSSFSDAAEGADGGFPIVPMGDTVEQRLRSLMEHPLYLDPVDGRLRDHVRREFSRAYPGGEDRDATGRNVDPAPAIRPEDVASFDPSGSDGRNGGTVHVRGHTRDGHQVSAYERAAPGGGGYKGHEGNTPGREDGAKPKHFGGAFGDFLRNYTDMREANFKESDKYFHCKANCEASRRGLAGEATAIGISELREWLDHHIKGDSQKDCDDDRAANRHGLNSAKKNPNQSCRQACDVYRPKGLPGKY
jgi:hypothetical protein